MFKFIPFYSLNEMFLMVSFPIDAPAGLFGQCEWVWVILKYSDMSTGYAENSMHPVWHADTAPMEAFPTNSKVRNGSLLDDMC